MIADLLRDSVPVLRQAGISSPQREARLLLAAALGVSPEDIIAERAGIDEAKTKRFRALVARRLRREPLAYILERREFFSLDFAVGEGVLVPRPDSEILVETALGTFPRDAALRVLDLGTGSGALLLAFLFERPNAMGIGIDVSAAALAYARLNARRLGLGDRAGFVQGRWLKPVAGLFDAIFINPPYIATEEIAALDPEIARFEPRMALDGGIDGLQAYRELAMSLAGHVGPRGRLFLEVGHGQVEAVQGLLAAAGLEVLGTVSDLAGIPRCLVAHGRASAGIQKKALALGGRSG